jgi:hypothetical protein
LNGNYKNIINLPVYEINICTFIYLLLFRLNYLLQQIWRTFDPSLLIGLRDMFEDVMARSAPSFIVRINFFFFKLIRISLEMIFNFFFFMVQVATDIESFEIGIIAPRIEK